MASVGVQCGFGHDHLLNAGISPNSLQVQDSGIPTSSPMYFKGICNGAQVGNTTPPDCVYSAASHYAKLFLHFKSQAVAKFKNLVNHRTVVEVLHVDRARSWLRCAEILERNEIEQEV